MTQDGTGITPSVEKSMITVLGVKGYEKWKKDKNNKTPEQKRKQRESMFEKHKEDGLRKRRYT